MVYSYGMQQESLEIRLHALPVGSQLELLEKWVRAFNEAESIQDLGSLLLTSVAERTGATRLSLLARKEQGPFRVVAGRGLADLEETYFPAVPGTLWQQLQAGEPFLVTDLFGDHVYPGPFRQGRLDRLHSVVWLPLCHRREVVGILTLDREFRSDTERAFVTMLVSRAATALAIHLAVAENRRLRRELKSRERAVAAFENWGQVLNGLADRYQQLENIVETAREALRAEKVSIMLLDPQQDELVVRAIKGVHPELEQRIRCQEVPCRRIKLGQGVAGKVAQDGQPVVVNHVREQQLFTDVESSYARSILCVPLKTCDFVFGVMNFTNKSRGRGFTRRDLRRAEKLAGQAAEAMDNARLYELAVKDPLTGVYTRTHFHHLLDDEMARARRYQQTLSLQTVTINNLAYLQSQCGHQTVNVLLVELAAALGNACRKTDTVARLGEGTFAVLLPQCQAGQAIYLADRVLDEVTAGQVLWTADAPLMDLRFGICSYPDRSDCGPRLLDRALSAMKEARPTPENIKVFSHPAVVARTPDQPPVIAEVC